MKTNIALTSNIATELTKLQGLDSKSKAYAEQLKVIEGLYQKFTKSTQQLAATSTNSGAAKRKDQAAVIAQLQKSLALQTEISRQLNAQAVKNKENLATERQRTNESRKQASSGFGASFRAGLSGRGGTAASGIGQSLGILARYSVAGLGITAAFTAIQGVVSGMKESVRLAIEFEANFAKIAAVTGQAKEDIEGLNKSAKEIAGTTIFNLNDIQGLQLELAKLGFSVREITESAPAFAELAQATGEDLVLSATTAAKAMRAFNLQNSAAVSVSNALVGVVNESALTLEKLGTGLQYVSPISNSLGISLNESAAALGVLANNGFTASRSGTGLRRILLELGESGKSLTEILKDVSDSNLSVAEAQALVGTRGATALLALSREWEEVLRLTDESTKSLNAYIASAKNLETVAAVNEQIAVAWQNVKRAIGEAALSLVAYEKVQTKILLALDSDAGEKLLASQVVNELSREQLEEINEAINNGASKEEAKKLIKEALLADAKPGDIITVGGVDRLASDLIGGSRRDVAREVGKQGVLTEFEDSLKLLDEQFVSGAITIEEYETSVTSLRTSIVDAAKAVEKELEKEGGLDSYRALLEGRLEELSRLESLVTGGNISLIDGQGTSKLNLQEAKRIYQDIGKEIDEAKKQIADGVGDTEEINKALNVRLQQAETLLQYIQLFDEGFGRAEKREKASKTKTQKLETSDDLAIIPKAIRDGVDRWVKLGEPNGVADLQKRDRVRFEGVVKGLYAAGSPQSVVDEAVNVYNSFWAAALAAAEKNRIIFGLEKRSTVGEVDESGRPADRARANKGPETRAIPGLLSLPEIISAATGAELGALSDRKFDLDDVDSLSGIIEGVEKVYETIAPLALDIINRRLEAEKRAIDERFKYEEDRLEAAQRSGLISQAQYEQQRAALTKQRLNELNEIEEKQFNANKTNSIIEATIAGALATIQLFGKLGPVGLIAGSALTAAQIGIIASQKFVPTKFEEGGWVNGPSHENGGVPFSVQGRGGYEMEGGEFIVNKRAMSNPSIAAMVQAANAYGSSSLVKGGKTFAAGGEVSGPPGEQVSITTTAPVQAFISPEELSERANAKVRTDRRSRLG